MPLRGKDFDRADTGIEADAFEARSVVMCEIVRLEQSDVVVAAGRRAPPPVNGWSLR
jgi:hypothetical protein